LRIIFSFIICLSLCICIANKCICYIVQQKLQVCKKFVYFLSNADKKKKPSHEGFYYFLFFKCDTILLINSISLSDNPETFIETVFSTPKRKSVETSKTLVNSTIYCVDGVEIPISQAFIVESIMPSCLYIFYKNYNSIFI